ncbi:MAG TPA: hypothetical protein VEH47_00120 [Candidatus Acidoferrales bacterium]|nr:hypothetical protein [Candidatus Acidoferrales bacterium]
MTHALRLTTLVLLVLATASTFAQTNSLTDSQKAFAAIKNMPGMWEGTDQGGKTIQVNFKVTSGGSAVMSEILGQGPEDMISMFHLDGPNRLLMTHYCGVGNQPRMQASLSPDGKTITFNFVDATNLATPDAGHMQRMVLTMLDENHHTEEWTFADHGKEMKELFDLHRVTNLVAR